MRGVATVRTVAVAGALALLCVLPAASARAAFPVPAPPGAGSWSVACPFTHRAMDDPIVHHGHSGLSHMHDFIGNPSTDAFSTRSSLLAADGLCTRANDRSAYWAPALVRGDQEDSIDGSGKPTGIVPAGANIYYLAAHRDPQTIRPFPRGLRVVAGNPGATSPQNPARVSWYCKQPGVRAPDQYYPQPQSCMSSENLYALVRFPDCSDGRPDSANHKRHMAYSTREAGARWGTCPASHPIPVPQVVLHLTYPSSSGVDSELASGGRFSLHADFFEAWRGKSVRRLIRTCLRADLDCGARPSGVR